jgi:alpha-amylase/alpha-mannosidase (GH57 family)
MDRYLCIHCHFYQPPRENPWLESVELQESAYPYHDWNERITAECYAPNSASRILDGSGRISRIVNNYLRISFNFGPTLLSWMEVNAPDVYESVLAADRHSQTRHSGHGSAIAQAYNHIIMPLANRRDKETQVIWGIRDFESRFGRLPEGMWLPETAVDMQTLEILAEHGIKFTILAPHQARQARRHGRQWRNVEGGRIDPKVPYSCHLPSGKRINLFFYDGPISRAVAFEQLLSSGEDFANRLMSGFTERRYPQLMHIATDGETYGHHHRHGDMALSYALSYVESKNLAKITNYGEFLEKHPAIHEVEMLENTSWSCAHGIERWRSNCGCNSGRTDWQQDWRKPLRNALDFLRDDIAGPYEQRARKLIADPWGARNDYIGVVLNRSSLNVEDFFRQHQTHELDNHEQIELLRLLEMQRHAMLMYTSCGWFFDELSGIETVQVIQYAARAIQMAQTSFGDRREERFLELMAQAPTNIPDFMNGAEIYRRFARPAMVNLLGVGAHYAIKALFRGFEQHSTIYAYEVDLLDSRTLQAGRTRIALGRAGIRSRITRDREEVTFGVLHLGDNNVYAGVHEFRNLSEYESLLADSERAFANVDIPDSIRTLDRHFGQMSYSLKSLFKDERQRVVRVLLASVVNEAEAMYRQVYENHAPLMRFLSEVSTPLPKVLSVTSEFVVNAALRRAFESEPLDLARIASLLDTAKLEKLNFDQAGLSYSLTGRINSLIQAFAAMPDDINTLERMNAVFDMVRSLPFQPDLWRVQNVYYELTQTLYPKMAGGCSDPSCREWVRQFTRLGEKLGLALENEQNQVSTAELYDRAS